MDKDNLREDYRKKKDHYQKQVQKRQKQDQQKQWLTQKISTMPINKLHCFLQTDLKKYLGSKLQPVALKALHSNLSKLTESWQLYAYDKLRSLYRKYENFELTEADYMKIMRQEKFRPAEVEGLGCVRQFVHDKAVGISYYYWLVTYKNEIVWKCYCRKELKMPEFNYKGDGSEYLELLEEMEKEEDKARKFQSGQL